MGTRQWDMIVGPETSALPTAGTPTVDADNLTKGYGDSHYLQAMPVRWTQPSGAAAALAIDPLLSPALPMFVFIYPDGEDVKLVAWVRVPSGYKAGTNIKMRVAHYSPSTTGTVKLKATTYLVRAGIDAVSATSNSQASTNAAISNAVANRLTNAILDLTGVSAAGEINGAAIAAGDLLRVELTRDYATDTDTADTRMIPELTEVYFG
jgi:hypothetical protein